VKCAIVAWSGTADTVTSDIVSVWNGEGTNPTLIANATYENTPANLSVTTSFASYSVTANVDTASTKNIIVFIWSDVKETTVGDFLHITNVQLESGSTATGFDYRPFGTELALCQRYYWLQNVGAAVIDYSLGFFATSTATTHGTVIVQNMRTTPSFDLYPAYNVGSSWNINDALVNAPLQSLPSVLSTSPSTVAVQVITSATLTRANKGNLYNNTGQAGYYALYAEL
jgi:hypothetical protein